MKKNIIKIGYLSTIILISFLLFIICKHSIEKRQQQAFFNYYIEVLSHDVDGGSIQINKGAE